MARLVATDLDGTLVRTDGTVSPYAHDVIAALDDAGVPVVFVTGRPLRWAEEVFEYVGAHGLAVVSNGALVWDVVRGEMHHIRPITREVGLEVCRLIREAVPGTVFAIETVEGIALETDFHERHPVPPGSARGRLDQIFDGPAVKVLARHEAIEAQEFWDRARAAVGELAVITWSSNSALLEISAEGVTKASTLALVCEARGVAREDVVAFGDMPNDLPMLSWAGTSYAMANAHPSVIEAADHVAPSNDDDGVATVLVGLFDL